MFQISLTELVLSYSETMVYESVIGSHLIMPEEGQRQLSYTNKAGRYSSSGFIYSHI